MEVILKQDIKGLGFADDKVKVANGYARNYLLPNQKALRANAANRKVFDTLREIYGRGDPVDAITAGALPYMSPSMGMMALVAQSARGIVGDSGQVTLLAASVARHCTLTYHSPGPLPLRLTQAGPTARTALSTPAPRPAASSRMASARIICDTRVRS